MRALVTGAGRGIGAAIAERLREADMDVLTLDRDPVAALAHAGQAGLHRAEGTGEVDARVAFLGSEAAGSITGEEIGIPGGLGLGGVSFGSERD